MVVSTHDYGSAWPHLENVISGEYFLSYDDEHGWDSPYFYEQTWVDKPHAAPKPNDCVKAVLLQGKEG